MALVTVDELATYQAKTYTAAQENAASVVLENLEGDLEAYLGRPLVPTVFEAQTIRPPTSRRPKTLLFPKTPVVSIEAFTIDGTAVASTDYVLRPWGVENLSVASIPSGLGAEPEIVASYTAGLPGDDPDDAFTKAARAILFGTAARILNRDVIDDAAGVSTLDQEAYSVSYAGASSSDPGSLFHETELARLVRWKKRTFR